MDQPTVTLIIGLGTIAMSGVVSSIVTSRLGKSKEQQAFMRSKAEQLYLATDEFGKGFNSYFVGHFQLLNGRIDYNQMLDMQISAGSKDRKYGGPETMTMLVEIYFPTTRDALANVWRARSSVNSVATRIKDHYREFGDATDPDLKVNFVDATNGVHQAIKELQHEIVQVARHHAGERVRLSFFQQIMKKLSSPLSLRERYSGKDYSNYDL